MLLDFIVDNYIIIIIILVILIMTLIGYITEKNGVIKRQNAKLKDQKQEINTENKNSVLLKKDVMYEVLDRQIKDGKNLVLEEGNLDVNVELDEYVEPKISDLPIEVSKNSDKKSKSKKEDKKDEKKDKEESNLESEPIEVKEDTDENKSVTVLNLDDYDTDIDEVSSVKKDKKFSEELDKTDDELEAPDLETLENKKNDDWTF